MQLCEANILWVYTNAIYLSCVSWNDAWRQHIIKPEFGGNTTLYSLHIQEIRIKWIWINSVVNSAHYVMDSCNLGIVCPSKNCNLPSFVGWPFLWILIQVSSLWLHETSYLAAICRTVALYYQRDYITYIHCTLPCKYIMLHWIQIIHTYLSPWPR